MLLNDEPKAAAPLALGADAFQELLQKVVGV
jgi:hypothetical protein